MKRLLAIFFVSLVLATVSPSVRAENWPCWRGPRGDGTSLETDLPVRWSATENIAWKRPIPYRGHASPIVWEDFVFLVGADEPRENRMLMALDRQTGETLWERVVLHAPLETINRLNSYASSTPATDGERIYVTFLEVEGRTVPAPNVSRPRPVTPGQMVVAAYDFQGRRLWMVRPGPFVSVHGFCSSPVLFEDLVIVNGDHDGDSYIVALDRRTGRTVWKTPRKHHTRSYCTPIIRQIGGRLQMMLSGDKSVCSYDPRDGSLIWFMEGPTEQFVASLVDARGLVLVTGGFPERHMLAIDPSGRGNITDSPYIKWHHQRASLIAYVPSPIAVGDYFYCISDRGFGACYEAVTGRVQWQARMGRRFSASLVAADGLIYCLDDDGICKVIRASPKFELVAENRLGEPTYASIAISQGQLFLRTLENLYCIGKPRNHPSN
ncbi:MAG: PQQ-binding-like beta-propeller repeat protein [Planctomycetes bacterium]|nr:PQQ-binding-like beta-propeller repeat protein [Planctomycetota bacterium]